MACQKKLNRICVLCMALKDAMHGDGKEVPVHEMYGALDRLPDEWHVNPVKKTPSMKQ